MNKLNEICYFVETLVDDYSLNKRKPKASFFKYLQSENIDRKTINEFLSSGTKFIKQQIVELDDALCGKDEILKEAYSRFRKPELREFKQMLTDIIDDAEKYKETKKIVRKPKVQTPDKIVKGLNLLETSVTIEGKEYIPPSKTDIVGSKYIVFYNVKTNDLTIFVGKKLSCKGSRIIDFDETKSGSKKLKNISESLDLIIHTTQFNIEQCFDDLPNKIKSLPKIINSNFILLKVIK
jgi:hypothetical protein